MFVNNDNNELEEVVDPQINEDIVNNPEIDLEIDDQEVDTVVGIESEDDDLSLQQSQDKKHSANSRFAEMRRENDDLKNKLRKYEEDNSKIDNIIKELYGDQGVTDSKSLVGYVDKAKEEQIKQEYLDKGVDPDLVSELVQKQLEQNPLYQEIKRKEEEGKLTTQLVEFSEEYPQYAKTEVKDLPNIQNVVDAMKNKGLSFTEAFTLVNRKEILKQNSIEMTNEIKKKIASNSINRSSQSAVGTSPQVITSEDISNWKKVYSGYSDEEITAMIKKNRGIK